MRMEIIIMIILIINADLEKSYENYVVVIVREDLKDEADAFT